MVTLADTRIITAVLLLLFIYVVFPIAHALLMQNGQPPIMRYLARSFFFMCISAAARIFMLCHPYEVWARAVYLPALTLVIVSFVQVAMTTPEVNSFKTYNKWVVKQFIDAGRCFVAHVSQLIKQRFNG